MLHARSLPSVEGHSRQPWRFSRVLGVSFALLLPLQLLVAVSGYLTFGDLSQSPVLCNLPAGTDSALGRSTALVKLLVAVHLVANCPMLLTVVARDVERAMGLEEASRGCPQRVDAKADARADALRPATPLDGPLGSGTLGTLGAVTGSKIGSAGVATSAAPTVAPRCAHCSQSIDGSRAKPLSDLAPRAIAWSAPAETAGLDSDHSDATRSDATRSDAARSDAARSDAARSSCSPMRSPSPPTPLIASPLAAPLAAPRTLSSRTLSPHALSPSTSVVMLSSAAVGGTPTADLRMPSWRHATLRAANRTVLVATPTALAISLPYFAQVLYLIGAMGVSMMVYVLPVAVGWRLLGHRMRPLEKMGCACILVLGVVTAIAGTYFATATLLHRIQCTARGQECGDELGDA